MKTLYATFALTVIWTASLCSPFPHPPYEEENIRFYELNITRKIINPDCSTYQGPKLVINGQLPGPPIRLISGERVRVLVRNLLPKHDDKNDKDNAEHHQDSAMGGTSNDISIHFHGIRQIGSTDADGVPFLTQKPIPPGGHILQEFRVVGQAGTFFYHAHVGLSIETVNGPLIVYESKDAVPSHALNTDEEKKDKLKVGPYEYDEERLLFVSEYWHRTQSEFENYLLGPNFTDIPDADSVLLNGRTIFNTSDICKPETCDGYSVIEVEHGKTYRLRVIGSSVFRTIGVAAVHHTLTVIEVDGELVNPYKVEYLEVAPGQRFSVLLEANQKPNRDYAISTILMWEDGVPLPANGFALLRYNNAPKKTTTKNEKETASEARLSRPHNKLTLQAPNDTYSFPQQDVIQWEWLNLSPLHPNPIIKAKADRTIKIRVTEETLENGTNRWYVNGVSFMDPKEVILHQILRQERRAPIKMTTKSSGYDPYLGTYPLKYKEIIDFVLQSTHYPGEPCRTHPWHMHGHTFYEIAYGAGEYDETRDGKIRNVPKPIGKDVTLVYPILDPALERNTTTDEHVGCGWSKIRMIAVKCHLIVVPILNVT